MNFAKYGESAASTAIYLCRGGWGGKLYVTSEFVGELGECFNVIKKVQREGWSDKYKDKLIGELGGCMWSWSQIYYEFGIERYLSELPDSDGEDVPDIAGTLLPFKDEFLLTSGVDPRVIITNTVLGVINDFALKLHSTVLDNNRVPNLAAALGEVTVAINGLCRFLGFTLHEVMDTNLNLLAARQKEGTLTGSGDGVTGRDN